MVDFPVIDKIKERLAKKEMESISNGIDKVYEEQEKARKNPDGSLNIESHDFRMQECMPIDVRMMDRFWKNDVEMFLEMIYDMIKDKMRDDYELSDEVYELKKLFDRLKEIEESAQMKRRWDLIGMIVCFFLEFDLAYRWRMKYALQDFDLSKWDYTPEDAYWLSMRADVDPPEVQWSEDYCREWQEKNYGEVLMDDGDD